MENGLSLEDYNKLLFSWPVSHPYQSIILIDCHCASPKQQPGHHHIPPFFTWCRSWQYSCSKPQLATWCNHDHDHHNHVQGLGKSLFALPPGWVWQSGPGRRARRATQPSCPILSHPSHHPMIHDPKLELHGRDVKMLWHVMACYGPNGEIHCVETVGREMFTSVPNAQCKCWRDQRLDNIRPCYSSATI